MYAWLWFPGTQVSKIRAACWHQQPPNCRCAAISRLPLLAHEIPEAGDLDLRLRARRSGMKHRGVLCPRPIYFGFAFFQELWFREDVRVGVGMVLCILVFPGRKGLQPRDLSLAWGSPQAAWDILGPCRRLLTGAALVETGPHGHCLSNWVQIHARK